MEKTKTIIKKIISSKRNLILLFFIAATVASVQSLMLPLKVFVDGGLQYTHYNNYQIFEQSFYHLKNNQDLYILYPKEYWDLYKYTPTFSALFGFFALLPDWLGLNLWNLLNAFVLLFAVYYLPKLNNLEKGAILVVVFIELLTSMQSAQSNGLIAGLLVFSFGLLEDRKYLLATLCIVFSVYIKLFGFVGFALLLLYPQKWKLALYSVLWTLILFVVPLLFVDLNQYLKLFQSYWNMLSNDHSTSYGYSVMGWLKSWFGAELNKNTVVVAGAILFLIPLSKIKEYKHYSYRYLTLASILIWIVIFNHKAESPTFIIAITGIALWFIRSKGSTLNIILFVSAFIFTSLSPTDIFPKFLRENFVVPYTLKAFFCIAIWAKIIYDMLVFKNENSKPVPIADTVPLSTF